MHSYTPLSKLNTPEEFAAYLEECGIDLPFEASFETGSASPLVSPVVSEDWVIGNRWATLPLEGWDSDPDGMPTQRSIARWRAFGRSGAQLIWGESAAVRPDGRSSPAQLLVARENTAGLANLAREARVAHANRFGDFERVKVGIQITHSGRLSRPGPAGELAPVAVRHHPHLDLTMGPAPDKELMTDDQLHQLINDYVLAVRVVAEAGFDFVDLKACHGYLSHELLGAHGRPGQFGGSLENRSRFIRSIVQRARHEAPEIKLALRLSAFDTVAHVANAEGVGQPFTEDVARFWFGTDTSGHEIDMTEPIWLLQELRDLGVKLFYITGSSPYNSWHLQRPSLTSKPGEYRTPEDPLVGVARHIAVTARLKAAVPGITVVGSGYSYLQQWLPNVAQAAVRSGKTDIVGIARMQIVYPDFITDTMTGRPFPHEVVENVF